MQEHLQIQEKQTINFYLVNNEFYLVDAPGYGFANLSKERQKKFGLMMEDYLTNRKDLKNVLQNLCQHNFVDGKCEFCYKEGDCE